MDLLETVPKFVLRHLPHDDTYPKVVAALKMKHPGELLILYINWRDRLVPALPRVVMTSPELSKNPIMQERATTVSQIIGDIEEGCDLTKYLSRRVTIGFELSRRRLKKLQRLAHLDLLLNDWGVHHLHISTKVDSDGFVSRENDPFLLFAVFKRDRAYLIDIMEHNFADDRLSKIIINAWPEENIVREIKGVVPGPNPLTQDEIMQLRSAGIATFFQTNGRMFSPGASITTAGTSVRATFYANRILRALKNFSLQYTLDRSKLVKAFCHHNVTLPEEPNFEFAFFQEGFGVIETKSGVPIVLQA